MTDKTKVGFMATDPENKLIELARTLQGHSVKTDWLRAITLEAAVHVLRDKIAHLKARDASTYEIEDVLVQAEQWVLRSRKTKRAIK